MLLRAAPSLQNPFPMSLKIETPGTRKMGAVPSSTVEVINLSGTEDDDNVKILNSKPLNDVKKEGHTNTKRFEKGECSNDVPFVCEICTDTKTTRDSFTITGCLHAYCSGCVATYVRSKVEENVTNIPCPAPGCSGLLEVENCCAILPADVLDRWLMASCEATIAESQKFYCPFADCSALLVDDGAEKVRESECPNCRRLFCAQCKVPWHAEVTCDEFQKLGKDERGKEDIMLMKLAKDQSWKRCPNCKLYVAKISGCMYIKCRCGHAFCYNCESPNLNASHYCNKCNRTW